MADTGLFVSSSREASDSELITLAQRADFLGYHSVWTGESWGRDAFTVLAMIACHTQTMRVGTGIVNVFSRSPAMIAQSIASLDLVSQGRAILGLGSSGRIVIEEWHGIPYQQPLARTREYLEIIRMALAGETVNHEGALFKLRRFRLSAPPKQPRLPIFLASLGPKNLELTGQLADGWLPVWTGRHQLSALKETVAQAASRAGRDISQITVAPQILCYAANTPEELAAGARLMRSQMAYYIGAMGSYYYKLFRRSGYKAEADTIKSAWSDGDRARAAGTVSDDMLENICIIGDPGVCRTKLDAYRQSGADLPIIAFPHGASHSAKLHTLEALAPQPPPTASSIASPA